MRLTIEQQMAKQELTLAEGETPLRYRTLGAINGALALLANKALPTKESRIHIARCVRWGKPFAEEYQAEREHIRAEHAPDDGTVSDPERVMFKDVIGMLTKISDLDDMVVVVTLPKPITDAMLPHNSKTHPNNEDALSAIISDLGPLFEIDDA